MSQDIYFEKMGKGGPPVFWGHGWGQNLHALRPLADTLSNMGQHWVVDFPGFGKSPLPGEVWGTEEYANAMAALIRAQTDGPVIWAGHSFGCRVGLQLAARHPDLIAGLVLIAGAGLPRKRPLWHKLYYGARVKLFKLLKKLIPLGLSQDWLYEKFGSADYKSAGPLRQIFVKVVNEDLSDVAAQVKCPTLLIYGSKDTETPPEIGQRLSRIIPGAKLILMDGFDHYSILTGARHQVVRHIHNFMKEISKHDD
ncbi:MAG TPA: alpha/beta hydrolase [Alphaproteobacteria bacterium]|nr:MAG: alpha/beta hydrolase [Rhodospirillales bacterium]HOO82379.1 alpha/beta hydrolase [Alphaproteobacteria bacterium]